MTHYTTPASLVRVALLFGGKSAEHEISIQSATNVAAALDTSRFSLRLIGIDTQGGWHAVKSPDELAHISPASGRPNLKLLEDIDVVFPVLHGPMGEDGTIQGLMELMGLPYVGPNVLSSAVGMDKDVMKRLLRDADIATAPCMVVTPQVRMSLDPESVSSILGLPLFVKPANMGSSIGVSKVTDESELMSAIDKALAYDTKVLLETAIVGSEIECAVLGNEQPQASTIGRVVAANGFYSYDAKYHDEQHQTVLEIPAQLPKEQIEHAQHVALETYRVLGCEGLTRVDMFALADGQIIVNEVNTLPGFTSISMYPKLWEASGLTYTALITRLIELALQRAERRLKLRASHIS